jgi:hypothetical protein
MRVYSKHRFNFFCYTVVARSAGNAFHIIITESAYCTYAPVLSAVYSTVLKFQHCIQCWNFVILEQSMGARNRVEIGLSSLELIPGLLKSLKIPSQAKSLVRRGIIL